jgi:hypothetical protein
MTATATSTATCSTTPSGPSGGYDLVKRPAQSSATPGRQQALPQRRRPLHRRERRGGHLRQRHRLRPRRHHRRREPRRPAGHLRVERFFRTRLPLHQQRGDGTFAEVLEEYIPEISLGSMGADMADINNDGCPTSSSPKCSPSPTARMKTKGPSLKTGTSTSSTTGMGYHRQFARNMLHLNRGERLLQRNRPPGGRTRHRLELGRPDRRLRQRRLEGYLHRQRHHPRPARPGLSSTSIPIRSRCAPC